jgi:hypothetical protein
MYPLMEYLSRIEIDPPVRRLAGLFRCACNDEEEEFVMTGERRLP